MGKESLVLFSPAKVNLFFRVLSKRSDGYHAIASLYQAVSLGDVVSISLADEDRLSCDDPEVPCNEHNLMAKALKTFREKTGYAFKVHMRLEKKIPMQAGLGGGSGNAATVLFALNALSPSSVDESTLASWAAEFSSDAPFFFSTGSAFCTGRGEQLASLSDLPLVHFWLAKPQEGLSTPLVYKQCKPELLPQRDPEVFLQQALQGQLKTFNDLEHPAFALMPSLSDLKSALLHLGFSQVTMTGSGTAFMCFGQVSVPVLPNISFYPVHFIYRKPEHWYAC